MASGERLRGFGAKGIVPGEILNSPNYTGDAFLVRAVDAPLGSIKRSEPPQPACLLAQTWAPSFVYLRLVCQMLLIGTRETFNFPL